jgi:hypothetical protein
VLAEAVRGTPKARTEETKLTLLALLVEKVQVLTQKARPETVRGTLKAKTEETIQVLPPRALKPPMYKPLSY